MYVTLYLCIVCVVSASILRHVYLRNGIGVGHLTRVYGGMEYSTDSNVCIEVTRRLCSTEEIGGGGGGGNSEVTLNSFGQCLNLVFQSCYPANYVKPLMKCVAIIIHDSG